MKRLNIYSLRTWAGPKFERFAEKAPKCITPDMLTVISFLLAIVSAFFYYYSGKNFPFLFLLFALVFLMLSSFLDALDGALARVRRNSTLRGDFLDHVFDRYADIFLFGGIIFGGYTTYQIGFLAVIGVLLTSIFGTRAQALGLSREYRGILGRASRLLILILVTLLNIIYPEKIGVDWLNFSFLGWAMLIFATLGNLTALQRFIYIQRALDKSR